MTIESMTVTAGDKSVTITPEDATAFLKNAERLRKPSEKADDLIKKEAERVESETPLFKPVNMGGVAGERLLQLIERVERQNEEQAGIAADIRDVYAEAKSAGFETKIMREIVKLRKMDRQKRHEQEELLELYKSAIGLD